MSLGIMEEDELAEYFRLQYGERLLQLLQKFPNIEEQSESPSIRLLEKKKEAKIMHTAMEQKKEVGDWRRGGQEGPWGSEPRDSPPLCGRPELGVLVKLLCFQGGERKDLSLEGSSVLGGQAWGQRRPGGRGGAGEGALLTSLPSPSPKMFRRRMETLNLRWEELGTKEAQLKAHIQKFEQFIQENDQKRIRALKKANKERELKRQRVRELAKVKQEMGALRLQHQRLSTRMQEFSVFNKYLEKVVEHSEFEEIHEVISRYKTLISMHHDLMQSAQEGQEKIERAKARLARYMEEKDDEILQHNNELARLQMRFDRARSDVIVWESRWAHIQNTAAKKTLLLGTIKMAALNLFQIVSKQLKETAAVSLEDTHKQLDMVPR
uniref:DUF4200 domain-containing protein n=1 Tax=Felis catus TaxID=9685 RepID=A0ABI7Z143_FELCA